MGVVRILMPSTLGGESTRICVKLKYVYNTHLSNHTELLQPNVRPLSSRMFSPVSIVWCTQLIIK